MLKEGAEPWGQSAELFFSCALWVSLLPVLPIHQLNLGTSEANEGLSVG